MRISSWATGGLIAGLLGAQTAGPAFEAIEIRPAEPGIRRYGGFVPGVGLDWCTYTVVDLIRQAYDTQNVFGGPAWLNQDEFDIRAKAPARSVIADWHPMLQALLADRFGLVSHRGEWPVDAWALTVSRPSAIKPSAAGVAQCKQSAVAERAGLTCRNISMPAFTDELNAMGSGYFDAPVTDGTGLKGAYDLSMNWTAQAQLAADGVSLFDALREAGLKVERGKRPTAAVIVDRVNPKPTPNAAGVVVELPAQPTEFDVVDFLPSGSDSVSKRNTVRNGRVELYRTTLRELIATAYGVDNELVVGGEKWVENERYDLLAKSAVLSTDALFAMLRNLLVERCDLKVHRENRPVEAYALRVGKRSANLKETAGTSYGCTTNARARVVWTIACGDVTMVQFAKTIRAQGASYLEHPVTDVTGSSAAYDFRLSFTPANLLAESANGLTLFEALDRQLGLKLALEKVPMEVVAVDRIERPRQ